MIPVVIHTSEWYAGDFEHDCTEVFEEYEQLNAHTLRFYT